MIDIKGNFGKYIFKSEQGYVVGLFKIKESSDGKRKNETNISDNVFIGCSSTLVAPLNIEENVFIAAGSTITDNIPNNNFSIARSKQETKLRKHTSSI